MEHNNVNKTVRPLNPGLKDETKILKTTGLSERDDDSNSVIPLIILHTSLPHQTALVEVIESPAFADEKSKTKNTKEMRIPPGLNPTPCLSPSSQKIE